MTHPTLYAYQSCDTCRKALRFLQQHGIEPVVKPIRETPPTVDELRRALQAASGDLRKLFNTSGRTYREHNLKERLPTLSEAEALQLLSQEGNLVKRPLLLAPGLTLIGFRPEEWENALKAGWLST